MGDGVKLLLLGGLIVATILFIWRTGRQQPAHDRNRADIGGGPGGSQTED